MTIRYKDPSASQESFVSNYRTTFDSSILNAHNLVTDEYEDLALKASSINDTATKTNTMEGYFKTDVLDVLESDRLLMQAWINTLAENNGSTWSSSTAYVKNDVVNYNDNTYLCLKDTPAGTALSNTNYWIKFTLKGDTGYNSLGVIWKGQYQSGVAYNEYDLIYVTTGNQYVFYVANQDIASSGTTPAGDDSWSESLIIERRNLFYTAVTPTSLEYPYDWLFLEKYDDNNNVTTYNVVSSVAQPLNVVTDVPNVIVDTSSISYILANTKDMSTAIQTLYTHYNLK